MHFPQNTIVGQWIIIATNTQWKEDKKYYLISLYFFQSIVFLGGRIISLEECSFLLYTSPHLIRSLDNMHLWGQISLLSLLPPCRTLGAPKLFHALISIVSFNPGYWNFCRKSIKNVGFKKLFDFNQQLVQIATLLFFWDVPFSLDLQKTWAISFKETLGISFLLRHFIQLTWFSRGYLKPEF